MCDPAVTHPGRRAAAVAPLLIPDLPQVVDLRTVSLSSRAAPLRSPCRPSSPRFLTSDNFFLSFFLKLLPG